mgnify:CR=1 FL=1|tara:strand:+ start:1376 stop:2383 length:1008 start_codon:yes stop_codon:yes gene_type:complete
MKIYCILFDTCPQHKEIEDLFKQKELHYSDYITNSFTTTSLVSLFSGKTPSEMYHKGIGYYGTYRLMLTPAERIKWDEQMIFNNLPDDWSIHIHGDKNNYSFIPDECCGIDRGYSEYIYTPYADELDFISQMQELPSDENHFIVLKYNHYHDAAEHGTPYSDAVNKFIEIINSINFKEENSLFWLFSDHGIPRQIDPLMTPPHAWLTWVSITDNITKKKVDRSKVYVLDFYNTAMNRIYGTSKPNDILHPFDYNKIYIAEDGRMGINEKFSSCISAIKCLDEDRYIQYSYNNVLNMQRTIRYNNKTSKIEEIPDNGSLKRYLTSKNSPWEWYFRG